MPDLKLAKLPDRTPVKFSFWAPPDLARALDDYCRVYRAAYRQPNETVEELIPFMLATFMAEDPGFKKAGKEGIGEDPGESRVPAGRRGRRSVRDTTTAAATVEGTKSEVNP